MASKIVNKCILNDFLFYYTCSINIVHIILLLQCSLINLKQYIYLHENISNFDKHKIFIEDIK